MMTDRPASATLTGGQSATAGPTECEGASRDAPRLEAVLFDLDGVITDTAQVHAAAWKQMFDAFLAGRCDSQGGAIRPFDIERDYRQYVDGKPRRDGVAGFLASRGISLPYGSTDDGPEAETICGLSSRKNGLFLEWLEHNHARAFPDALRLVKDLRDAGIKTAVFSASRNAETVLRGTAAADLFDARVDGNDLLALGLPGKPSPAMLLEAARRLGVTPANAAVVEDAVAGVTAGRDGGFGIVIGVTRGRHDDSLRQAGADLVLSSLGELSPEQMCLTLKIRRGSPSAVE